MMTMITLMMVMTMVVTMRAMMMMNVGAIWAEMGSPSTAWQE